MEDNSKKPKKGGRKPKNDRADYRYTVNLTEEDNAKFMALFRRSESKVISRFIAAMIFGREMKVVKIDNAVCSVSEMTIWPVIFASMRSIVA
jgi:hypothetical protein